jgi:hypothetical protein
MCQAVSIDPHSSATLLIDLTKQQVKVLPLLRFSRIRAEITQFRTPPRPLLPPKIGNILVFGLTSRDRIRTP